MGCSQVWGIQIKAKDKKSFEFLKPKIIDMFDDDVEIVENNLTFYKHTYTYESWHWFDYVKEFFKENAKHMDPDSLANVWYFVEPDDIVSADDFQDEKR